MGDAGLSKGNKGEVQSGVSGGGFGFLWNSTAVDVAFLFSVYAIGSVLGYYRYCGWEYLLTVIAFITGTLWFVNHSPLAFLVLIFYGFLIFWRLWLIVVAFTPGLLMAFFVAVFYPTSFTQATVGSILFAMLLPGVILAYYICKDLGSPDLPGELRPGDAPAFEGLHFTTVGLLGGITVYYSGYGPIWSVLAFAGLAIVSIGIHKASTRGEERLPHGFL